MLDVTQRWIILHKIRAFPWPRFIRQIVIWAGRVFKRWAELLSSYSNKRNKRSIKLCKICENILIYNVFAIYSGSSIIYPGSINTFKRVAVLRFETHISSASSARVAGARRVFAAIVVEIGRNKLPNKSGPEKYSIFIENQNILL